MLTLEVVVKSRGFGSGAHRQPQGNKGRERLLGSSLSLDIEENHKCGSNLGLLFPNHH